MHKAPGSITERGIRKEEKMGKEGGWRGDEGRDGWRWGKREAEIKYQPSKPDDLHSIPRTHIYRRKLTPQCFLTTTLVCTHAHHTYNNK